MIYNAHYTIRITYTYDNDTQKRRGSKNVQTPFCPDVDINTFRNCPETEKPNEDVNDDEDEDGEVEPAGRFPLIMLYTLPSYAQILHHFDLPACPTICSHNQCGQLNCQNQLQLLLIRNTTVVSIYNHCRLRQHNDTVNKGIGQDYLY